MRTTSSEVLKKNIDKLKKLHSIVGNEWFSIDDYYKFLLGTSARNILHHCKRNALIIDVNGKKVKFPLSNVDYEKMYHSYHAYQKDVQKKCNIQRKRNSDLMKLKQENVGLKFEPNLFQGSSDHQVLVNALKDLNKRYSEHQFLKAIKEVLNDIGYSGSISKKIEISFGSID